MGGPIATEDVPTRIASRGAAPYALTNGPLNKRSKESLCMHLKSATILYRKWD
jgi:hypothetical protein